MYGKSVLFSQVALANICSVRFYKKDSTKKLLEFLADMPKSNSSRISVAQRLRQNITKKSEKYGPSTVYLQVLGSGAMGAPNTLYLFTDQKRYLFNCGECTQRLAHEHKVKLSRLDHIFITSKTWRNIGGLPGLSLTLQDVGVPSITLHGPDGLDELYNATKRFVIMKDMNVNMATCTSNEDFEDNAMSVKYVLLGPLDEILLNKEPKPVAKKPRLSDTTDKGFESFIHDDTDYYRPHMDSNKLAEPKKYVKERGIGKQKASEKLPDPAKKKTEQVLHDLQKQSNCSVAYICTLKKRLGTLDLAKCVELGVKPGPLLGQLKSGHDVILPDGSLVMSKDVKTPDDHGPVFIVLDVPDLSYLKESEFSSHFDNGINPPENIPTLIVHYTPPHVFHNPAYRAFMTLFGATPRHLILNGQNSCLGSEAVHRTQHKLHLLDPDIFPLLRDVSVPAVWNAQPPLPKTDSPIRLKGLEELKNKIALAQFQNIINMQASCKGDYRQSSGHEDPESDKLEFMAGRTLTMFHLRPKKQLDRSAEPKLHIQDYIQETMDVDGFVGSLEQFRRLVDSMRYARTGSQKEYPKVVFLGTGSCIPSKTRNTSAIVLHIDENRSMLLDCGEGTFGQLVRFYGPKRVNSVLRTLKAIYVSHLHADHHIGLIGVLQARRRAFEEILRDMQEVPEPVYLMAPGQIVTWLSLYDLQFEKIRSDYTLIPNQSLVVDIPKADVDMTSAMLANIGVRQIQTCMVSHCPNAFGVSIEVEQYKITYSGDTIPCEALVKLGENSSLLIHEATMEDELADEARTKMHSTTTQAIEMGRRMNAKYTVLTHFSQRYARLPRLNANILNDNNSVGIAFDNMQITMNDLELLPHMYAPLQLMFAEHCVEMELKAASRARQKERRSAHQLTGDLEQKLPARNVQSSPVTRSPAARYRESNSSRLRQEIKGMTLAGTVRNLRSKSSSPSKTPTPSSTPRSQNSGRSTPRLWRDLSQEKPLDIAATRARSPNSGKSTTTMRQESRAEGIDVITTPRTMSATSNDLKDVDARHPPAPSPPSNISSAFIVDTRSKTINTVPRLVNGEVAHESGSHAKKNTPNDIASASSIYDCNGYGKPLVTPINRRLTLRREVPTPPFMPISIEKVSPNTCRSRSPLTRKAENRRCPSPSTPYQCDISKTKIPTKISESGNKLRASTSANVKQSNNPMSSSPVSVRGLKGSTSSLTHNRCAHPARQIMPIDSKCEGAKQDTSYTKIKTEQTNSKNRNTEANSSGKPSRIRPPLVRKPYANGPEENNPSPPPTSTNHNKPNWNYSTSCAAGGVAESHIPTRVKPVVPRPTTANSCKTDEKHTSRGAHEHSAELASKKSLPSLREALNETLRKQPLSRDIKPISVMGKPSSNNHSNRSFIPQLEDIKSSFILLNKKKEVKQKKENVKDHLVKKQALPSPRPKPINEEERHRQLSEIKRKFQSRGFFRDSKYDKIEGLNWITWK